MLQHLLGSSLHRVKAQQAVGSENHRDRLLFLAQGSTVSISPRAGGYEAHPAETLRMGIIQLNSVAQDRTDWL